MEHSVNFNNISKSFKKFEALKNISFQFKGSGVYGILGKNGAGNRQFLTF